MATEEVDMTNQEHLAEFDADLALQRLEVEPGHLTSWDLDTAVKRGELEDRLEEIDAELEQELASIEADDGAEFASASVVEFCSGGCPTPGDPDDLIIRRGLIFRIGHYGDVDFGMSRAELARAKQMFRPVPIRIEHKDTVLDGKLGTLRSVTLSADGSELHGEAALPRWLANLIPAGMPLKVSASWDRATKLLRELSLVLAPRIEGAALAAFSHSTTHPQPRPAMSRAKIDEHLSHTVTGRAVLANRRAVEFSATATTPAPPPTVYTQVVQQVPAPPTAEEDGAFVARLATVGPVAAETIRSAIASLEGRTRQAPHANMFNWPETVRGAVERAERLKAMLVAIETPAPYRAPSPEVIGAQQGETIVRLALASGKHNPSDLAQALQARLAFARTKAAESTATVERLVRTFAFHAGDVEALRPQFVHAAREASAWGLELSALEKTVEARGPAMASAVARAVAAAGGPMQVARDLADVRLVDSTPATADADAEELASCDGQIKALGASATGRVVQGLRVRRDELSESVEHRLADARGRVASEATALVESALAGEVKGWHLLAEAVKAHEDAFAAGLAEALEAAPMEALAVAGFAGFAGVSL